MVSILVTGGDGQLAMCFRDLESNFPNFEFKYKNSSELDISNFESVSKLFKDKAFDWCINCAAFTNVDKAEVDSERAFEVNQIGAKNLALMCKANSVKLIHISTDFVFNGTKSFAYSETDDTDPIGVYGLSKLKGEQEIIKYHDAHFIIRTSWLYSEHGNNFMKTMIKLSKTKNHLKVIVDQIGTPTYATDLAQAILDIVKKNPINYGLYHYSNEGVASWYDFAKAIFKEKQVILNITPIKSIDYETAAERPHFSVLDKTKIRTNLHIETPYWRDSLIKAIRKNNE